MHFSRAARCAVTEWNFPLRTLVGYGASRQIPQILGAGSRPLVVTDPGLAKQPFFTSLVSDFERAGLHPILFTDVHPNPRDTDVEAGVKLYHEAAATSVICVGGGSALDAGKCMAMVAKSKLQLAECDYFADSPTIPEGGELVPCITVPTTAGTGAEMDSGSMYTDTKALVKRCAGHTELPLTAVLDPELTLALPPKLTAWTGMDAVVHALEALFVPMYHPMADGIALEALRRIDRSLLAAYQDGSNREAREDMLVSSAMAAVAFQKGLGAVHGLSEPTGAVYDVHHGLTNAVLLPYILRDISGVIEDKCKEVAHTLRLPVASSGSSSAAVVAWAEGMNEKLAIPARLGDILPHTLDEGALLELADKAANNPTGFTNAVRYDAKDYERVLRNAL
eukprot:TRINITY_DN96332_c0_g1_i1.p1 TRINITY_DN96332_c0_g1~~TRINITY_DN96332_c0_g1_i1.p1  ORF type:complete len:394 (+),score=85.59 TRINITY_DN96332_c0_g1_i1:37-1218(+)